MDHAVDYHHLYSGGGGLDVDDPETDVFFNASANGTYTLDLTQPGSTLALTRIGFYYRAADTDDGWFYYVERNQANDAWDLKRSLIQSGTPTITTITTGVGTVAALRVTISGTSHVFESSADGESWTSRGSTTSAVHQTNTNVAAHYTGGDGSQLVANSDFSEPWVGTNPANWNVGFEDAGDEDPGVIEHVDGARILNSAGPSAFAPLLYPQLTMSSGPEYLVVAEVDVIRANGAFYVDQSPGGMWINDSNPSAGLHKYAVRRVSGNTGFRILPIEINTEYVLHYFKCYATDALDDGGATGPTRLYAS